ncbi:chloride channel CLIC-like protein 1 [Arapaima gigas]
MHGLLCCPGGRRVALLLSAVLLAVAKEQLEAEEWIDPTDMLNYDATTKTMRRPAETSNYENVPTKRREYTDPGAIALHPDITECTNRVAVLEKQVQEQKKINSAAQQPSCSPVFKRYLTKLLKELQKLGLHNEASSSMHYDAEVRLSRQAVAEIQKFIDGDGSWKTGALDEALGQILVNFKLHNYEAWKWRFEDTFGVELSTVVLVCICLLSIILIICSEVQSRVSLFTQFKRLFAICFLISIVWNWFYLYKSAFAEHQNNIVKMESFNEKCTGVKKIDWKDNLWEWVRTTWTLQDDPCKKYYEVLVVNPILLVSPTKALSVTITTFFTEPLKHFGQGISEFLRALLQDLPVTLQIPVLLIIALSILVFVYGSAQAAIQVGLARPLRGDDVGPQVHLPQRQASKARPGSSAQEHPSRRPAGMPGSARDNASVENVGQVDHTYSEDKIDGKEGQVPAEMQEDQSELSAEETAHEPQRHDFKAGGNKSKSNTDLSKSKPKTTYKGPELLRGKPSQMSQKTSAPEVSWNGKISHTFGEEVENIGTPPQETSCQH